ncbi:MAG: ABC transporter permease [Dehalococcoidia bacterium]
MIDSTIVRLTMRQVLGQKRTILMVAFALLPVLLAALYVIENDASEAQEWTATTAMGDLVIGLVLPFAALIFGTAALGQEFEDGTAVYLLAKPIPRTTIIYSKLIVAWIATAVVVVMSLVPTGIIGLAGVPQDNLVVGFVIGGILGSLAYSAAFLWLSVVTSRALIVGLLYVFIWEGVVVNLFSGVKFLSVGEYSLGIAKGLSTAPDSSFDPRLSFAPAAVATGLVIVVAVWFAIRALRRWQIGEST